MRIDLVSPLPADWVSRLWTWMHEVPAANLDDTSPRTIVAWRREWAARATTERAWGVRLDDQPVGVIAYRPFTDQVGAFHGICFTASVCGTGVPRIAVRRVLDTLWAAGVTEVHAAVFADNGRVQRFLLKLGAIVTGTVPAGATRRGQPIDLVCVQIINPAAALRKVS